MTRGTRRDDRIPAGSTLTRREMVPAGCRTGAVAGERVGGRGVARPVPRRTGIMGTVKVAREVR